MFQFNATHPLHGKELTLGNRSECTVTTICWPSSEWQPNVLFHTGRNEIENERVFSTSQNGEALYWSALVRSVTSSASFLPSVSDPFHPHQVALTSHLSETFVHVSAHTALVIIWY